MQTNEIQVSEVLRWIDEGQPFLLLDVRNREEFEHWKLEGTRPVETVNVPYFEFVEDPQAAIAKVPRGQTEIAVLCAKGGSSAFVAEVLRDAGVQARNITGGMIAYGQYLAPVKVPLAPGDQGRFEIWQFNRRGKGCLSYLVRSGSEAVLVDPSRSLEVYQAFAGQLGARIVRVFDTHVHADHLSGAPRLAAETGVPYFVAAGDGFELKQPVTPMQDGQEIHLGGEGGVTITTRIISTPGHTPGSTSYLVGDRYLLSGDTLFVNGVGRPDLGGQVVAWGKALFHTLRLRVAVLPDQTVILPAHYAAQSEIDPQGVVSAFLGELRRTSPELAITNEDQFVEAMRAGVHEPPAIYQEIIRTNLGLVAVDAEKATEWELGKNECAASRKLRETEARAAIAA